MSYPTIKILPGEDRRLRGGSPWLFSNELRMDEAARRVPPGSLVRLMAPSGKMLGVAQFNPHSLIAARMLTRNKDAAIDRDFVVRRRRPGAAAARAPVRHPTLPADPCRGRRPAGSGRRPVRRHAGRPAQHGRHGSAAADGRGGAGRGRPAARDRRPQRFAGAPARGSAARGRRRSRASCRSGSSSIENGLDLHRRSRRRAEDRLVLRPARQPPLRRRARARPGRARPLQLLRRLRADRGRAVVPRG